MKIRYVIIFLGSKKVELMLKIIVWFIIFEMFWEAHKKTINKSDLLPSNSEVEVVIMSSSIFSS